MVTMRSKEIGTMRHIIKPKTSTMRHVLTKNSNFDLREEEEIVDPSIIYHWDFTREGSDYLDEKISNADPALKIKLGAIRSGNNYPTFENEDPARYTDVYGTMGLKLNQGGAAGNSGYGIQVLDAARVDALRAGDEITIAMTFSVLDDYFQSGGKTGDIRFSVEFMYSFGTAVVSVLEDPLQISGFSLTLQGRTNNTTQRVMAIKLDPATGDFPTTVTGIASYRPGAILYETYFNHSPTTMGSNYLDYSKSKQTIAYGVKRADNGGLQHFLTIDQKEFNGTQIVTADTDYKVFYSKNLLPNEPMIRVNCVGDTGQYSIMTMHDIKIHNRYVPPEELPTPTSKYPFMYHFITCSTDYKFDMFSPSRAPRTREATITPSTQIYPSGNLYIDFLGDVDCPSDVKQEYHKLMPISTADRGVFTTDMWYQFEMQYDTDTSSFGMEFLHKELLNDYYHGGGSGQGSPDNYFTMAYGVTFGFVNGFLWYRVGSFDTVVLNNFVFPTHTTKFYLSVFIASTVVKFYIGWLNDDDTPNGNPSPLLATVDWECDVNLNADGYRHSLFNRGDATNRCYPIVRQAFTDLGSQQFNL